MTVAVLNRGILNQVGGEHRFAGFGIDDIGVHVREFRPRQRFVQEVEAVVEFMVAQVADGIIQGVHRLIHWMNIALFQPPGGHVVAQRAPLDHIPVIYQYAVFRFCPRLFDQGGGTHQAEFLRGGIFVIVKVHHIAVQIGGFHDPQVDRCGADAGGDQRGQERCAKLNHQRRPFFMSDSTEENVFIFCCLQKCESCQKSGQRNRHRYHR